MKIAILGIIASLTMISATPFASAKPIGTEGLHCEQGICWTAGERHDGWICPEGYAPCYPGPNATYPRPCFANCGGGELTDGVELILP